MDEMCESLGFGALSPEGPGVGEADVRDGFYQFAVLELGRWFGIDERLRAAELDITLARECADQMHLGHLTALLSKFKTSGT